MPSSQYHFITNWRVESTREEVADILGNAPDLVRWWPSVYLAVEEIATGDANGVGKQIELYTKGWLPYTLRWNFTVTENSSPYGFTLVAEGDFVGRGIWTFEQDGKFVNILYDWKIEAEKPLLKYGSPLFKPIFEANHHWAMAKGLESLKLELKRRHALTSAERAAIPAPPPATFENLGQLVGIGAGGIAALLTFFVATRRGKKPVSKKLETKV